VTGFVRRILALPEEIQFFGRLGAYGIGIGIVYWFLTYEVAGSLLLIGFGLATGLLGALLFLRRPRDPRELAPEAGPFHDESGRVPSATYAPLEFGFGLALVALAPVFGLPMAVASLVPLMLGGAGWLRAAAAEWRAVEAGEAARGGKAGGAGEAGRPGEAADGQAR
jgi:hypothetical protein